MSGHAWASIRTPFAPPTVEQELPAVGQTIPAVVDEPLMQRWFVVAVWLPLRHPFVNDLP